jgi:hypothetical protein
LQLRPADKVFGHRLSRGFLSENRQSREVDSQQVGAQVPPPKTRSLVSGTGCQDAHASLHAFGVKLIASLSPVNL